MNKYTKLAVRLAIALIAGLLTFLCTLYILNTQVYSGMIGLLGPGVLSSPAPIAMVAAVFAAFVAIFVFQLSGNRMYLSFLRVSFVLYLLGAIFVVLFKSIGVRGVNLNPIDAVATVQTYPAMLLLNIALFVPLGGYLRKRMASTSRATLTILALSLVLETLQYLLALGLSDIVDIATNTLGGFVGCLAWVCLEPFVTTGHDLRYGMFYSLHRPEALKRDVKRSAAGLGGIIALVAVLCAIAVWSKPPVAKTFVMENSDPTLVELVESLESGALSIDSSCEDSINVSGVVVQDERWVTSSGIPFSTLVIANAQPDANVASIEVGTSYPVLLPATCPILFEGEQVDAEDLAEIFMEYGMLDISCELVSAGSCYVAADVNVASSEGVSPEAPLAYFNFNLYTELYLHNRGESRRQFLVWSEDKRSADIYGYIGSTTEIDGSDFFATINCVDEAHGAPVLRSVNAVYEEPPSSDGQPEDPETYHAVLRDDGRLQFVSD